MKRQLSDGSDAHLSWCLVVGKAKHFWCKQNLFGKANQVELAKKCDDEYQQNENMCNEAAKANAQ